MFESNNRTNDLAQFMERKADFYHQLSQTMRSNAEEYKDHYVLRVAMPGCRREDISLRLEDGYLVIRGTRKAQNEGQRSYILQEIFEGRFERSYYVGKDVRESDINASFENGILTVTIPKKRVDTEDSTTIPIN